MELSEQTSTDTTITESQKKKVTHKVLETKPQKPALHFHELRALHSEEDIECMTTTTTTTYIA